MNNRYRAWGVAVLVSLALPALAQRNLSEDDQLRIAALEALMSAPPERALPAVRRVLNGDYHDEVKESALFILSQIETPESHALLLEVARSGAGELREEAIEMIGIAGDPELLAALPVLYAEGDEEIRESVLEAYLIAGDSGPLYRLALEAGDEEELEDIVEILAAMGANDELRRLLVEIGPSEGLIEAYAVAGDQETLSRLASDDSDRENRLRAIEALGIVGNAEADATLMAIYREATDGEIREAALEGMLISGHDAGMLELYRETDDPARKRELLEMLTSMGSDELWNVVDEALQDDD